MIVVTGAGGLVGGAVVGELVRRGRAVLAVVRPGGSPAPPGVAARSVDLCHPVDLPAVFAGASAVVHAAARLSGSTEEIVAANVEATGAVVAAATQAGARLVLLSSVAVYGDGDLHEVDEDRPPRPTGDYGRSKLAAEEIVRQACRDDGLDAWVLRPTTVYGADGRRGLSAWLLALARDGLLPIVGDGSVRLALVAATDLARACLLAADTPGGGGQPLHVTAGEPLTVGEVAERLRAAFGLPARTISVPDPAHPPAGTDPHLVRAVAEQRTFSIARARAWLGYRPQERFPSPIVPPAGSVRPA